MRPLWSQECIRPDGYRQMGPIVAGVWAEGFFLNYSFSLSLYCLFDDFSDDFRFLTGHALGLLEDKPNEQTAVFIQGTGVFALFPCFWFRNRVGYFSD